MSFEYAPVAKGVCLFEWIHILSHGTGLMMVMAASSLLVGLFDIKHDVHLQVSIVTHTTGNTDISPQACPTSLQSAPGMDHVRNSWTVTLIHPKYWRLGAHYMAFSSSAELFMAELLMYHVGIHVERQFGSVKFAVSSSILTCATSSPSHLCSLLQLFPRYCQFHLNSWCFCYFITLASTLYPPDPRPYCLASCINTPESSQRPTISVYSAFLSTTKASNIFLPCRCSPWSCIVLFSHLHMLACDEPAAKLWRNCNNRCPRGPDVSL